MKNKTTQSEVTGKQKKPYERPKAEFVPLKIEERLLAYWHGSWSYGSCAYYEYSSLPPSV